MGFDVNMFSSPLFENRNEAGKKLALKLEKFKNKQIIVLGIPRGGVVIGYEIAKSLHAALDIVVPRKLRAPSRPELAIGAITEDGTVILNQQLVNSLKVSNAYIEKESDQQKLEIERRLQAYKGKQEIVDLTGLTVIVVDDGIATGSTMKAALVSVRKRGAEYVVLAVPVASLSSIKMLENDADEIFYLDAPQIFYAIGQFYRNFEQVNDHEVKRLLEKNKMELS
ncbi:MAG: phosphoribosyltransferase [Candidatus Bathyarchaeota archaeon]|nr:phosphoribosyltransferase [Candidatus Bathyarchaeum tardum]